MESILNKSLLKLPIYTKSPYSVRNEERPKKKTKKPASPQLSIQKSNLKFLPVLKSYHDKSFQKDISKDSFQSLIQKTQYNRILPSSPYTIPFKRRYTRYTPIPASKVSQNSSQRTVMLPPQSASNRNEIVTV